METEIVEQAAREAGWVAALLVVIVLAVFGLFGWFIRQLWNMQIADRATTSDMHKFVREDMSSIIARDHDVMSGVTSAILGVTTSMQEQTDALRQHTHSIERFAEVISNAPCGRSSEV